MRERSLGKALMDEVLFAPVAESRAHAVHRHVRVRRHAQALPQRIDRHLLPGDRGGKDERARRRVLGTHPAKYVERLSAKGYAVRLFVLHAIRADRPGGCLEVDLAPCRAEDFLRAGRREHSERHGKDARVLTGEELGRVVPKLCERHGFVVLDVLHSRAARQEGVEVASPPGRVLARAETLSLRIVKDGLDAAPGAQPAS